MLTDLIDAMQTICAQAPGFVPRSLTNPNNKWLIKSALQKAIRRGHIQTALRMAEYNYVADPQYCWQGLATIIIEDIGFGDPELVSMSTQCTLKSVRDLMEPEMLYAGLVARACVANKTRACCELSLGCDLQWPEKGKPLWQIFSSIPENWETLGNMQNEYLIPFLCDGDVSNAYIAAVILRKRLRGKGIDALSDVLSVILEHIEGEELQRACMLSFERTVDRMNLALFPVVRMFQQMHGPDDFRWESDPAIDNSPDIRSVPAYAYDMHTMQGNRASKMFHTYLLNKDERFKLIPYAETKRPMGSLIFIAEGGNVSNRLRSEIMDDLKWFQDHSFMLGYGVHPTIATPETIGIVAQHLPALHDFRKKAAQ